MDLFGKWLVVIGYTLLFAGVSNFAGTAMPFMVALGVRDFTPEELAAQKKQDVWNNAMNKVTGGTNSAGGMIWNWISGLFQSPQQKLQQQLQDQGAPTPQSTPAPTPPGMSVA
jgi:hypothetical protein